MQKEVFRKKKAVLNEAVTVFVFRMDGKKKWPGEGIIPDLAGQRTVRHSVESDDVFFQPVGLFQVFAGFLFRFHPTAVEAVCPRQLVC